MLFKLSTFFAFATLGLAAAVPVDDQDACEWDYASSTLSSSASATLLSTSLTLPVQTTSSSSASLLSSTQTTTPASSTPTSAASTSLGLTSSFVDGDGTWYGESCGEESCWQGGACAFVDYVLPASIDGSTCVSELIWNSSYNCGGCVEITYKGTKKIAMITNKTGGDTVHLDMSPDMFSLLASKSLGEIPIQWAHVACPISSPLQIRMHGGASQYWFAATVENATLRTASLDVSTDSGSTWESTTRNINNFFEFAAGGGTGTTSAWIRLTSETGSQVVVKGVNMASSTVTTATSNYA